MKFNPDASNAFLELRRRMLTVQPTRADDVGNYPNVRSFALIECAPNVPPSPSKASTRMFTRIPIRRGSSLLTAV